LRYPPRYLPICRYKTAVSVNTYLWTRHVQLAGGTAGKGDVATGDRQLGQCPTSTVIDEELVRYLLHSVEKPNARLNTA